MSDISDHDALPEHSSGDPRVLLQQTIAQTVRPLAVASLVGTVLTAVLRRSTPVFSDPRLASLTIVAVLIYLVAIIWGAARRLEQRRADLWATLVVAAASADKGLSMMVRDDPRDFAAMAVIVIVASALAPAWLCWGATSAAIVALLVWFRAGTPSPLAGNRPPDPATIPFLYAAALAIAISALVVLVRRRMIERLAAANRARIEARTETAATAAQMHSIIESSSDGIVIMDDRGNISGWNPAAERIFGWTRAEIIGRPLETLIRPDHRIAHRETITAALRDENPGRLATQVLEVVGHRKDGTPVEVEIALSGWKSADGRQYFSAAARDVSDRKAAEEARRSAETARWQQRNALDINEQVVQGLVVSLYALDEGDLDTTRSALHDTLASARSMVASTLGNVRLGDILRESAPPCTPQPASEAGDETADGTGEPRRQA